MLLFVDYRLDVSCPALPFGGFCLCVCVLASLGWILEYFLFIVISFSRLTLSCHVCYCCWLSLLSFCIIGCVCVCVQENACGEGKVNARILLIPNGMQRNTIH